MTKKGLLFLYEKATVTKKKMWYHMKKKTLEREYEEFHDRLVQLKRRQQSIPEEQIRLLTRVIQRYKQELQYPDRSKNSNEVCRRASFSLASFRFIDIIELRAKHRYSSSKNFGLAKLHSEVRLNEKTRRNIDFVFFSSLLNQFETAQTALTQQKSQQLSRIQLELISGGNIRFEEGSVNDIW